MLKFLANRRYLGIRQGFAPGSHQATCRKIPPLRRRIAKSDGGRAMKRHCRLAMRAAIPSTWERCGPSFSPPSPIEVGWVLAPSGGQALATSPASARGQNRVLLYITPRLRRPLPEHVKLQKVSSFCSWARQVALASVIFPLSYRPLKLCLGLQVDASIPASELPGVGCVH